MKRSPKSRPSPLPAPLVRDDQRGLREMNEALLVSSVRQHELADQAQKAEKTARDGQDRYRDLYGKIQQTETALRGSERELSDFFENASIGLHWAGPDGNILRVNQAELDLLGYAPQEYVGRHIGEFHVDQPVIEDILARLLRGETLRDHPARMRAKDGSIREVLINSSALFKNGEFIHTRCFTHDVTEQKRAERLIDCQKQSLEMLVQGESLEGVMEFLARSMESQLECGARVAIHLMEADGYHFGYVAAPSLPAKYAQATKGMDARLELGCCSSAVVSHTPTIVRDFAAESRWPGFTAEVVALGLRGCFTTPILSPDNRVLGTFAIYYREPCDPSPHDRQLVDVVTRTVALAIERKQAEQALRDSEEKHRAIFDGAAVSLWEEDFSGVKIAIDELRAEGVTDFSHYFDQHPEFVQKALACIRVLDVNDSTVKMFEARDKTELLGSLPKIFVPDSLPVFVEELITVAEGRTTMQGEALLNTVRGNPLWVLFTMTLPPDTEKLDRVLFSVLDITERKRAAMKIAQQAEEIADESRRKDEFLAMLSHELRNPLAPIRTALHLLRMSERGSQDAIQQQAHSVIERQVGNLTRLVSDLLEVSRVINGRIRLEQRVTDLNEVIQHALQTAMPLIEQRKHEAVLDLCTAPVWANLDATRMEEVLVNILTNAAKYTPDGGRIVIWCELPRGQNSVQVRVRDNGVGIDEKLLPRIFDLFTQADRSLDRAAGGLGIGLSLAHRLVELQGGTIVAHSPPEGESAGSEFIVRFPLMPAPQLPAVRVPVADAPQRPEGVRVLVVDDNMDQTIMLSTALRHMGYSVQSAYTGPDALKVALQWRPDIMLMDIGLPGMDGYEVARSIRSTAKPDLRKARLVALTGYGRDTDVVLAREAGFDAHMVKPIDLNELEKLMATPKPRM